MNIRQKTSIGRAMILASALIAPFLGVRAADSVSENRAGVSVQWTEMPPEARRIAVSAVLVDEFTTNATMVTKLMLPKAKEEWVSFCRGMIIDGKQYFLPDFFKVKYTFIGGSDDSSFALGVYSPFYDAFMLMRVCDTEKVPKIEAFHVATVSRLRGLAKIPEFPPASGSRPADGYLAILSAQVRLAGEAFHAKFLGTDAPARLATFAASPENERGSLLTLHKARLGLLSAVATEREVKANAVLADLVVRDERFGKKSYVETDASTWKVLDTLAKLPMPLRKSIQFVSYFMSDKSANFLYLIPAMPTTLVQVNVKDGRIWLKMFDARFVNGKKTEAK